MFTRVVKSFYALVIFRWISKYPFCAPIAFELQRMSKLFRNVQYSAARDRNWSCIADAGLQVVAGRLKTLVGGKLTRTT
jgi:hypothetical protein